MWQRRLRHTEHLIVFRMWRASRVHDVPQASETHTFADPPIRAATKRARRRPMRPMSLLSCTSTGIETDKDSRDRSLQSPAKLSSHSHAVQKNSSRRLIRSSGCSGCVRYGITTGSGRTLSKAPWYIKLGWCAGCS